MIISLSCRNVERLLFSHDCFQQVCRGLIRLTIEKYSFGPIIKWSIVSAARRVTHHFISRNCTKYSNLLLPFLSMLLCMVSSLALKIIIILVCVGLI